MMLLKFFKVSALVIVVGITAAAHAQSFSVGQTFQTLIDTDRNREIPIAVYYPAITQGTDVAVASTNVGFPVISFGHGFVIDTESYSWLWEALVPQGYILVFPQTEGQLLPPPNHAAFGRDIAFCAEEIVRRGALSSGPFAGKVLPRVALMGHSMGGGAAYLGAVNNAAVTTTVTFAAADTDPSSIVAASEVLVPSLVIAAVEDCVTPLSNTQEPIFSALPAPSKAIVRMEGASHCNYTDGSAGLCYLGEGFSCFGFGPFISINEQHARSLQVLEPWLERFLKSQCNSGESLLDVLSEGATDGFWTFEIADVQAFQCPEMCAAPTGLEATGTATSGYMLSWREVPYALGYRYQARVLGGGPSIEGLTASYFVQTPQVPANLDYEFRVRAFCPGLGFSAWSSWKPVVASGSALQAGLMSLHGKSALMIQDPRGLSREVNVKVLAFDGSEQSSQTIALSGSNFTVHIPLDGLLKKKVAGSQDFYVILVEGSQNQSVRLKVAY